MELSELKQRTTTLAIMNYIFKFFLINLSIVSPTVCQLQPTNITRDGGESNVFIPCPFEFRATPSIWRINGVDYTDATIPSDYYSITKGGLFINTVHVCMNQTSFQCIDTSDNVLGEEQSDIGVLTVISQDNCTGDFPFYVTILRLELDHRLTRYSNVNTTLAWKIVPLRGDCNISHLLSYKRCEQNYVNLNLTTGKMMLNLSVAHFQRSGELVDFYLSSSSSQPLEECPSLTDALQFNITETETVNLLLGNNNCTRVDVERRGGLSFAISNPDPNEVDILCRIHANGCYSPAACRSFGDSGMVPFFHICDNTFGNSYTVYFGNISKQLNGLRFDFFSVKRALCISTPVYVEREYFRSFELNVANASASISVNLTSREICFISSSNNCSLTDFTQYNISIVDISGNALFKRDNILESTCLIVSQLELLPQCGPFLIYTQPINKYIIYNPDIQEITSDNQLSNNESDLCFCLEATTQLELTASYNQQSSVIEVEYQCWTVYTTRLNITLSDENGSSLVQITCSNGTFELMDSNQCDYELHLCGSFTFTNGTVLTDCSLNCSNPVVIPCPTIPNTDVHFVEIIIGSLLASCLFIVAAIVIVVCLTIQLCRYRNCTVRMSDPDHKELYQPVSDHASSCDTTISE